MFEDADSVSHLIESHGALVAELAALEQLAHHLGGCPGQAALDNLAESVETLPARLAAHMAAEEREVYPGLVDRLGALAVASMVDDHREIRQWAERLAMVSARPPTRGPELDDVRWTLLVVIGLVNLHLRKEEVAYVGLLGRQVETVHTRPVA